MGGSAHDSVVSLWGQQFSTADSTSGLITPVIGNMPSPPPKVGLLRCLEVSWAVGDPLVPECETYFWLPGPNGPELMANPSPGAPEPGAAMPVPTPAEIIEYAVATVTAGGSGLTVQPAGNALVGIPSLVHAATPAQTLETSLFGTRVVVSLEATGFSYDFGDGTAPLVTSDPSAPYPVTRLAHTYTAEQEGVVVVLTTRWAGTVTSPFTGETATVDGVVTTSESSAPFDVRRARIDLVAD
ncbi:hypothetical protein [Actinomyces culturomici]|uniref:hypothetical protein n=1 Tax=Actinomyces culturomici TaxID=1926276 RepID=UPI00135AAD43|nr:hypothetical protein [Actinomyces culturomici]